MPSSRSSGILLHITSLPSPFGIGDLGPTAYRFADFLADAGQQLWQVLPLGPAGYGGSPYSSPSTFAGNPLFISPELLRDTGLLTNEELALPHAFPAGRVDFSAVPAFKHRLLTKAFDRFEAEASSADRRAFDLFCADNAAWLDDYALFMALKEAHDGAPWMQWSEPLTLRASDALAAARDRHARCIRKHKLWQHLFDQQWMALRDYAHRRSLRFFGDLPIYVADDSADVWANQDLFHLDAHGRPTEVAGVPPDAFSATGQRWGNPIYRWDRMRERGYSWWTRRFEQLLNRVDLARVDHFRGFAAYWAIPADAPTAEAGTWEDGPGADFFHVLQDRLGSLPVVAEDLGLITDDVVALRQQFGFPGMAILHFAFEEGPSASYLPHNHVRNLVAYTGTHDNNTTRGWWASNALSDMGRAYARDYLALDEANPPDLHWRCARTLMASVANRVILPLQDVLGLGAAARMNNPGDGGDNWTWRFTSDQLTDAVAHRLAHLTRTYGRAPD